MNELAKYDAMVSAIAAVHTVDEVKDIHDKAKAMEVYSKLAKDFEQERRCREIRLRAERRAGQLLSKMEKAKGARGKVEVHVCRAADVSKPRGFARGEVRLKRWDSVRVYAREPGTAADAS